MPETIPRLHRLPAASETDQTIFGCDIDRSNGGVHVRNAMYGGSFGLRTQELAAMKLRAKPILKGGNSEIDQALFGRDIDRSSEADIWRDKQYGGGSAGVRSKEIMRSRGKPSFHTRNTVMDEILFGRDVDESVSAETDRDRLFHGAAGRRSKVTGGKLKMLPSIVEGGRDLGLPALQGGPSPAKRRRRQAASQCRLEIEAFEQMRHRPSAPLELAAAPLSLPRLGSTALRGSNLTVQAAC